MAFELHKPKTPRKKKADQIRTNQKRGKAAEEIWAYKKRLAGDVERTGRGSDYRFRETDPMTGRKGKFQHYEIKSSDTAKKSPLQKKKRASKRVVRPTFDD